MEEKEQMLKKLKKIYNLHVGLFFVSLFCLLLMWGLFVHIANSHKLYDINPKILPYNLEGLYYGNGYYCINTALRTQTTIQETNYHENCHYLTHKDPEHFCGWFK